MIALMTSRRMLAALCGLLLMMLPFALPVVVADHDVDVVQDACALDPAVREQWQATFDGSRGCATGVRADASPVSVTLVNPATTDEEATAGEADAIHLCASQGVDCDRESVLADYFPIEGVCPTATGPDACVQEVLAEHCGDAEGCDVDPSAVEAVQAFIAENLGVGREDSGAWVRLFGANESASVTQSDTRVVLTLDEDGEERPLGGDYRAELCLDSTIPCATDPDQDGEGGLTVDIVTELTGNDNPFGPDEDDEAWIVRVVAGANGWTTDSVERVLALTEDVAGPSPVARGPLAGPGAPEDTPLPAIAPMLDAGVLP